MNITPVRIQLSRVKGFNLQQHSKSINGLECRVVSRPTKYGNPFKIMGDMIYGDASHRRKIFNPWIYIEPDNNPFIDWTKPLDEIVISLYIHWLAGKDTNYIKPIPFENLDELRGKNLGCWCNTNSGTKCHADILLGIFNGFVIF